MGLSIGSEAFAPCGFGVPITQPLSIEDVSGLGTPVLSLLWDSDNITADEALHIIRRAVKDLRKARGRVHWRMLYVVPHGRTEEFPDSWSVHIAAEVYPAMVEVCRD